MNPPLLVVGTGRCGTGYAADLLTRSGLPCDHEVTFNPSTTWQRAVQWRQSPKPEASWLAVPWLPMLAPEARVVFLVRDPEAVVRSFVGIRFFSEETPQPAYTAFARLYLRPSGNEVGDAVSWCWLWTDAISRHAAIRIKIEDMTNRLGDLAELAGATLRRPINARKIVNARRRYDGPIDAANASAIQDLRVAWGYE